MNSKKKNTEISNKIRLKGNKHFMNREYFEACAFYNQALCYAESNSIQLGLCYSNRSAAFFKVKQYEACLQNIGWARENQLPEGILPRLNEREIECKKLMAEQKTPSEETWNDFFKLTYEPNPKFPYLANCLEVKKHKSGLFLATNQDLKAGDIIAITEPFIRLPSDTGSYRCNYCLADKFMNFIPCTGCAEVMFCNESCMENALKEFHQFECGIDDNPSIDILNSYIIRTILKCLTLFNGNRIELEKFMELNMKKLLTPFDFDLSDPLSLSSQKNIMLTQFCENQQHGQFDWEFDLKFFIVQPFLHRHPKLRKIVTEKMFNLAKLYTLGDAKRFKSIGGKVLSKFNQSNEHFAINYYGDALDICFNLLHYSCAPNMVLHPYNNKIVWVVNYPIKANDYLTVACNNMVFFEKSRKERLKEDIPKVVIRCECPACVGNWDRILPASPCSITRLSSEEAIQKYREYCDEINNAEPLMDKCDQKIWFHVNKFRWNLISIGKPSFWDKVAPKS